MKAAMKKKNKTKTIVTQDNGRKMATIKSK